MPVLLRVNNQCVVVRLVLMIVRFRTYYVQFYTFGLLKCNHEDQMDTCFMRIGRPGLYAD